jgi:hypothetical protein
MQDADTRPSARPRLTPPEIAVVVVAIAVALGISASLEIYDTRSPTVRVALTVAALFVSYAAAWLVLIAARIESLPRLRAAIFAVLPSALLLSQMPYLGYLLVPIEILVGAWLARSKGGVPFRLGLLVAAVARGCAMVAVWALHAS